MYWALRRQDEAEVDKLSKALKVERNVSLMTAQTDDVFFTDKNGDTLVHIAVSCGFLDLAEMIARKGVSLSTKNKKGLTPLDFAESNDEKAFLTGSVILLTAIYSFADLQAELSTKGRMRGGSVFLPDHVRKKAAERRGTHDKERDD